MCCRLNQLKCDGDGWYIEGIVVVEHISTCAEFSTVVICTGVAVIWGIFDFLRFLRSRAALKLLWQFQFVGTSFRQSNWVSIGSNLSSNLILLARLSVILTERMYLVFPIANRLCSWVTNRLSSWCTNLDKRQSDARWLALMAENLVIQCDWPKMVVQKHSNSVYFLFN